MKHFYFLSGILISGVTLQAQITLTNADFPQAGDSARISLANSTGSVDHTLTGVNYLWDFSSLTPFAQQMVRFEQPVVVPFNFFSDFGILNPTPDSLPAIGAIPSDFTDFYKNGSSSYRQVGSSFAFQQLVPFSIPVFFSPNDTVYRFPINYGNSDSCFSAYSFTIPGLGYIGQDRKRVNVVDGWGTLITPTDTLQVLRMRTVLNLTDTISLDTTNQTGFTLNRPTQVIYQWLGANKLMPVLQVDCQVIGNTELVTGVRYQDSLRSGLFQVGLPEMNMSDVRIFPVPANDNLTIDLADHKAARLEVYSADGRLVYTEISESVLAQGKIVINVSDWNNGLYLFSVIGDYGRTSVPVIIGH